MRVPTLAAVTLAALAVQHWGQQAIAAPQPDIAPPQAEPTDALPGEDEPELTEAIAVPESFVAESSSDVESTAAAQRLAEALQEERLSAARLAGLTHPDDTRLVEPSEPLLEMSTSQNRTQDRIQDGPQSGVEIPIQTPRSGQNSEQDFRQNSGLIAQTQTSATTASVRVSIEGQALPVPGVLPLNFQFPIRTQIVSDGAIAADTPITDQEFPNPLPRANIGSLEELARYRESRTLALTMWKNQVRSCLLDEYPNMVSLRRVRRPDGTAVDVTTPILFNGRPGRIVRNANGRLVCPII
jgi:hypothetical protein